MICEVLHTTLEVELFDLINFVGNDYWLEFETNGKSIAEEAGF